MNMSYCPNRLVALTGMGDIHRGLEVSPLCFSPVLEKKFMCLLKVFDQRSCCIFILASCSLFVGSIWATNSSSSYLTWCYLKVDLARLMKRRLKSGVGRRLLLNYLLEAISRFLGAKWPRNILEYILAVLGTVCVEKVLRTCQRFAAGVGNFQLRILREVYKFLIPSSIYCDWIGAYVCCPTLYSSL